MFNAETIDINFVLNFANVDGEHVLALEPDNIEDQRKTNTRAQMHELLHRHMLVGLLPRIGWSVLAFV